MARKRRIEIPEGLQCNECGSVDLIGAGTDWKKNPNGDTPTRIVAQKFLCKTCGKRMVDGEVKDKQEV